jgi:hypothetical protein
VEGANPKQEEIRQLYGGVSVSCRNCKKDFTESNLGSLISKSSAVDIKPKCPTCKKDCTVVSREIGCPSCKRNFWAFTGLNGRKVDCPNCSAEITLPTAEEWAKLKNDGSQFKWNLVSADSGEEANAHGLEDMVTRITSGRCRPDDICAAHSLAPWRKMRDACDEHFELRKLYDPLGVYTHRAGNIVGVTFGILYLVGNVIGGLMTMGGTYLLVAIFGILGVVLTPTIIGLVIVYFIARVCGISLLWAYIGVVLTVLGACLAYLIGMGIGRGATWVFAKATGIEGRRTVNWN